MKRIAILSSAGLLAAQSQQPAQPLTLEEQEVMRRALRRSVTIISDTENFRFPVAKPQTLTGKWCAHCAKDNHDDADCWSTRAVKP